ncbi:sugar phosphate isomerase/epimerase [Rhizobium sp. XQZ8]|uniref:sugar phosphate isomerase/epimerase family protein n=1 Tax=Rhizobium populisoli TaxID=2859785 RepID=UPI001C67FE41|nr:sugar phosphate isomerase/epimerase family protein [Rhizobium populisoli]MBW6422878.1 sugar phosphate isomerase/epimerase [Rhizobium populisoli]
MRTIRGPALFIAQFINADPKLSTLDGICEWAAGLGFKALQVPTFFSHIFDVKKAAESQAYVDDFLGVLAKHGLELTELTSQRQGQLLAVHPAFDLTQDGMAPAEMRGNPAARQAWAEEQLKLTATASKRLGIDRMVTFSGSLLWPYLYPYPPVPQELVSAGFAELAKRWKPVLDHCEDQGVDICYELHPTEDLHDGSTFERFLDVTGNHQRVKLLYDPSHFLLQHVDYIGFIDLYADYIRAFHVKDAEFVKSARTGVYGGYNDWTGRAGRFRSPGDGQIDFKTIFSRLTGLGYNGWATLEWECCFKNKYDGAREGRQFISDHIIAVTETAFDAKMRATLDEQTVNTILGIGR